MFYFQCCLTKSSCRWACICVRFALQTKETFLSLDFVQILSLNYRSMHWPQCRVFLKFHTAFIFHTKCNVGTVIQSSGKLIFAGIEVVYTKIRFAKFPHLYFCNCWEILVATLHAVWNLLYGNYFIISFRSIID